MNQNQRGQTLVASLVVIAIIAILAVVLLRGGMSSDARPTKADGRGTTVVGAVKANAEDEVCKSNLNQVRQLLVVAKTSDEELVVQSVDQIPGAASVSRCPVGKEPYVISADSQITCPHVGHEKF